MLFERSLQEKTVQLPSELQKLIRGKRLIISLFPEGCLFIGSQKKWKGLIGDAQTEENLLVFEDREEARMMLFNPQELSVGESGKISIPTKFKKIAQLEKKVILVGYRDYIEIWDSKRWQETRQEEVKELYGD